MSQERASVVIIGGGVAGLRAAYDLHNHGVTDFVLLEANDYFGGRVKSSNFFQHRDVEIGAELLHGDKSLFTEMVKGLSTKFAFNLGEPDPSKLVLYFSNHKNVVYTADHKIIQRIDEAIDGIEDDIQDQDHTLHDYFSKAYNKDDELLQLTDCRVSITNGNTLKTHGLWGYVQEERRWLYGQNNYVFTNAYSPTLLQNLVTPIRDRIRLNSPVHGIIKQDSSLSTSSIQVVYGPAHKNIVCDFVIVAVPLSMLRHTKRETHFENEQLVFQPQLSMEKQLVIDKTLRMDGGFKVLCQFSSKFFKQFNTAKNMNLTFVGDAVVPQFWLPVVHNDKCIVVGFCAGPKADQWSNSGKTDEELIKTFIDELDNMVKVLCKQEHKNANQVVLPSQVFEKGIVQNWTKVPYIRGGYSTSGLGAFNARDILARPEWDKTLFFAGEATNLDAFGTVQGALESGRRAAREICREMFLRQVMQEKSSNMLLSKL